MAVALASPLSKPLRQVRSAERDVWSIIHENLHPACGSPSMLVTLTGQIHDEINLTGGGCREGKVVRMQPASNDAMQVVPPGPQP
jgi:hypothetical protein